MYQPVRRTCSLHFQGYNAGCSFQKTETVITPETSIRQYRNTRRDIPEVAVCGPVLCVFHSPCVPLVTPISSVSNLSPYCYMLEITRQEIPIARCFSTLLLRHIFWAQINLTSNLFSNVLYIFSLSLLRMSIQASSTRRS